MNEKEVVRKSKFLSLVLRHDPGRIGIILDSAGWTLVDNLLIKTNLSMDELEYIVEKNNKKRFEFNDDKTKIRASQGHSLNVDLGYEEKDPPETLYHGTAERFIDSIKQKGISKQKRHHVHLSDNISTAKNVGQRHGKSIVIAINSRSMKENGHKFYLSTNGVWLTEFVPVKYIGEISQ